MNKRVLVTGGSGFIGSHVVKQLLSEGAEVAVLARGQFSGDNISTVSSRLQFIKVDLVDAPAVTTAVTAFAPHWVFHLANAGLYGGTGVADAAMIQTNVVGLVNLLASLAAVPYEAFINGASSAEYGAKTAPMRETDVCQPLTAYAAAKLAATTYASMVGRNQKKPIISFRIFSPFGPYDNPHRLIPSVITGLLANQPVTVSPDTRRDYVYVEDCVQLLVQSARMVSARPELFGEIFNLGSGIDRSSREVVEVIQKVTGITGSIQWNQAAVRSWESPVWQADMSKTTQTFAWQPTSFEEGISKTVTWSKQR